MLEVTWLLFRDSSDLAEKKLADRIAEAARNLQDCRTRHGFPSIPAVLAACALANGDLDLLKKIPDERWQAALAQKNHYRAAFAEFVQGKKQSLPGFADDQQYRYYAAIARNRTLTEPMAWKTVYDALSEPMAFDKYYDDARRPQASIASTCTRWLPSMVNSSTSDPSAKALSTGRCRSVHAWARRT